MRRFDPFRALSEVERAEQRRGLEGVLRQRDGTLDFPRRRLEAREASVGRMEASGPRWRGAFDAPGFQQTFHRQGRPRLDRHTTWLAALARSNECEDYGVQWDHRRHMGGGYVDPDPLQRTILIEEDYHSRLLRAACRVFGVEIQFHRPGWIMRNFIRGITYLPESIRHIPILCGEIVGTIVFAYLREELHLFDEQPEVVERLHVLLSEVMTDEALHVAYCRLRMGPAALRTARLLAPLVAMSLLQELPQLRELGLRRRDFLRRLGSGVEIPAGCDWLAAETAPRAEEAIAGV